MFGSLLDDGLNPRFIYRSPVFRDELDARNQLPSDRLATHVAEAVDSFHAGSCRCDDETGVVRDLTIEFLTPVRGNGALRIDVWLEDLDATTCTYGFLCSSDDGLTPHARGERTVNRIDPQRLRPSTWSDAFMQKQSSILRTLHGYS